MYLIFFGMRKLTPVATCCVIRLARLFKLMKNKDLILQFEVAKGTIINIA